MLFPQFAKLIIISHIFKKSNVFFYNYVKKYINMREMNSLKEKSSLNMTLHIQTCYIIVKEKNKIRNQ